MVHNDLSGTLPSELGLLKNVYEITLPHNNLTGSIPSELGDIRILTTLDLLETSLSGSIPRSLIKTELSTLYVPGGVCVPADEAMQTWFKKVSRLLVERETRKRLFMRASPDYSLSRTHQVSDLALPEAEAGLPPITYTLSPNLPDGLVFNDESREIMGAPTEVSPPRDLHV